MLRWTGGGKKTPALFPKISQPVSRALRTPLCVLPAGELSADHRDPARKIRSARPLENEVMSGIIEQCLGAEIQLLHVHCQDGPSAASAASVEFVFRNGRPWDRRSPAPKGR